MLDRLRLLLSLLLFLLFVSCGSTWRQSEKKPISGLWISSGQEAPEASDVARLQEAGVGEIFVEVARLDLDSSGEMLERGSLPTIPSGTPVTLVIRGAWPRSITEPAAPAELAAEALQQLRFDVEARGWLPVGFHFDFGATGALEAYGTFLEALREEIDRSLFLSASVARNWVDDPELARVAGAADFLVAFLYGQRPGEQEDPTAWDFIRLEKSLQTLESLNARYMIGLVTVGMARHLSSSGQVKAHSTEMALQTMLWNRNLKLRAGFSLEGVNRQVYTMEAERRATVGSWQIQPGESIRVVRSATAHLEELLRLVGALHLEGHLGQVYYRLPRDGEDLSLSLDNLLDGLAAEPATPEITFDVKLQRRTGRGWIFRFVVDSSNGENSEFSLLDNNFLQVVADQGTFSNKVEIGDFYRYELYRATAAGVERTFRQANAIRLHVPLLGGKQTITSGDIELIGNREPIFEITASFLLPDGRTLELGPATWRRGELELPGDEEAPEDAALADEA